MKTFLGITCLALAVAFAVVLGGSSDKSRAIEVLAQEAASLSNQVAQAKASTSENESALMTLQTRIKLQLDDLGAASNRLAAAHGQVVRLQAALRTAEESAQQRGSEAAHLEGELARAREQGQRLDAALRGLEARFTASQSELTRALGQMTNYTSRLNLAEVEHARWVEQWYDPSAVRARSRQLAVKTQPPAAPCARVSIEYPPKVAELLGREPEPASQPAAPPPRQKLKLQADGTVQLVPAEAAPTTRSGQANPK